MPHTHTCKSALCILWCVCVSRKIKGGGRWGWTVIFGLHFTIAGAVVWFSHINFSGGNLAVVAILGKLNYTYQINYYATEMLSLTVFDKLLLLLLIYVAVLNAVDAYSCRRTLFSFVRSKYFNFKIFVRSFVIYSNVQSFYIHSNLNQNYFTYIIYVIVFNVQTCSNVWTNYERTFDFGLFVYHTADTTAVVVVMIWFTILCCMRAKTHHRI